MTALVKSAGTITVSIGGTQAGQTYQCTSAGACHFSVDFGTLTGTVAVVFARNGQTVLKGCGEEILSAPSDGRANYAAWVGSASGIGSCSGGSGSVSSVVSSVTAAPSTSHPSSAVPSSYKQSTLSTRVSMTTATPTASVVVTTMYVYVTPIPSTKHNHKLRRHRQ